MKTKYSSIFLLTNHAIEQYVSRKHISTSENMFLFLKKHIDKQSFKLKEKTSSGEEQWLVPSLNCILITKPEKGKNVIVTIINNRDNNENFYSFEERLAQNLLKFDTISNKKCHN